MEDKQQPTIQNIFHDGAIRVMGGRVQIGGVQNNYGEADPKSKVTDKQLVKALLAINGRGKAIHEVQVWLGVLKVLPQYGWPHDLKACAERVNKLPGMKELDYPCNFESIRKLMGYKFAQMEVRDWTEYEPTSAERAIFIKCRDAAVATAEEIEKVMAEG